MLNPHILKTLSCRLEPHPCLVPLSLLHRRRRHRRRSPANAAGQRSSAWLFFYRALEVKVSLRDFSEAKLFSEI